MRKNKFKSIAKLKNRNLRYFLHEVSFRYALEFISTLKLTLNSIAQGSKYSSKSDCEAKRKRKFFREKLRSEAKRKIFWFVRSEAKRTIFQNCEKLRKNAKLRKFFLTRKIILVDSVILFLCSNLKHLFYFWCQIS